MYVLEDQIGWHHDSQVGWEEKAPLVVINFFEGKEFHSRNLQMRYPDKAIRFEIPLPHGKGVVLHSPTNTTV